MSDYYKAEICFGGTITEKQVKELAKELAKLLHPYEIDTDGKSEMSVKQIKQKLHEKYFCFTCYEALNGMFEDVEAYCRKKMAFIIGLQRS